MSKPLILGNIIVGTSVKKIFKVSLAPIQSTNVEHKAADMPTRARKIRSVSFSLVDPMEARMNVYADHFTCFSTYVKRLVQRDMENGVVIHGFPSLNLSDTDCGTMTSDLEARKRGESPNGGGI